MRLFVAVRFPDPFLRAILEARDSLKNAAAAADPSVLRANYSREENLHLTLAFIGERPEARSAVRALETVRFEPYPLSLGKPRKLHDILVLGIADGGETVRLASAVRASLDQAGIPYDQKPPLPHITLARKFSPALPAGSELTVPQARCCVSSFALMKSERIGGVLTYTALWQSPEH